MARTAVIVDDHAGFRSQAARLLASAGYEVVGSCADGRGALDLIGRLRPDVALVDVQLPDIDGFGVVERLGAGVVVVLVSTREAADYGARIARSGAAGFITKADLTAGSLAAVVGGPPP